ncbi:MAG: response regulator [Methyloceanibacter sp.]|uniref:response regulator n=1 Tax=Methyloceanibacter sp. TaxID=1965321 RepID=UPI003D9BE4D8
MQAEDFKPDYLFAQIQGLVDALAAERGARERAEIAEKAKSELLGVIGHELRAPMGAILSMAELLLGSRLDNSQRRYAQTLEKSARSLLTVLNDILDFSQVESGRFELDCVSFDLHELLRGVMQDMRVRASEKGLKSGLEIGLSCPRFVVGDPARLRQILNALTGSALAATEDGSLRLYVRARDSENHLRLRFDITASGGGLSQIEALLCHDDGTGLGPSLAGHLIEMMGGELGCDSVAGHGSVVWFTVAAARGEAQVSAPACARIEANALSGHLLVVEANAVNRMLIGTYLSEFGLTYEIVDSGAEAILCLSSSGYDLVLMDITMPGFDGAQTAKRIRTLSGAAGIVPIVALTAATLKAGGKSVVTDMDACVAKPIRGRELHAALAPFLAHDDKSRVAAGR